ncbi:putative acyl-CoA dehydrogenase [Rhodotorula diobovata]|uniref:Putative acyl-CoA dehydrogenase n=1 Tax=Rhodotorula diobovata TaxID=5288 RepID=A0A5C5FKD4_9BASI|nr:putative acyl-CoA dehydrogenase [Rhodotorula diobovata]
MTHSTDKTTRFGSLVPFAEPAAIRDLPSPYYNESHHQLRKAARAWVQEHIMDVPFEWEEETKVVDPAVYASAAREGIVTCLAFGTSIPKKWAKPDGTVFGGVKVDEWDGFHDLILIDEIHRNGSLGVGQGLFGGLQIGCPPIYHFGSQELQDRVLPDIMSGKKRVCLAITEPEAGSDVKNLSTEAVLSEDGKHYIVNGTKKWITNGIYSDYFTAAVRTSGKAGEMNGISFLLIPNGPGVTRRRMLMSGQHCAGTTFLSFEDVKVPVENIIGEVGQGFKCIMNNFRHERLMISIVAQRIARVALEDSLAYAHRRKVFGKRLIDSEVIRNKFAHMARVIEAQQAWLESIVYASDRLPHDLANQRLGGTTALLKAHCGITLELVAREAVQVLGGIGHTRGGVGERVERIRRDVRGITIPGGSEEIMLDNGIKQELRLVMGLGAKL